MLLDKLAVDLVCR